MNKHIFYYTPLCPECPPFLEELKKQNIEFEAINITENISNLKQFIRLRDEKLAFDSVKKWGFVGIPLLVTKDEQYIFDINDLMGTTCAPTQFTK